MAIYQLVIAPTAKTDLGDIYRYGLRQWGQARSASYLDTLNGKLWALTEQPYMGAERPELLAGIRSLSIESHTLFYRVTDSTVDIIRVLHGRQDPVRHIT